MAKDRKSKKRKSQSSTSEFSHVEQRILDYVKQPSYKAKKSNGLAKKLGIRSKSPAARGKSPRKGK